MSCGVKVYGNSYNGGKCEIEIYDQGDMLTVEMECYNGASLHGLFPDEAIKLARAILAHYGEKQ